ncbi:MAG TPA: histidinol dehydrogenase, partial [Acidimicrobiia bacterium]|nr:histidinol dehydrogenase [Acidimicrobiia bacterium]
MINRLDLRGAADFAALLQPPLGDDDATVAARALVAEVRARGDAALRELTERFDGPRVDDLRVPAAALRDALASAEPAFRAALEYAR